MKATRVASMVPLRGRRPRSLGRTNLTALAWTCAVLFAAGGSATWVAHRLDERPAAHAAGAGASLGAGSAIALPFGHGVAVEPAASEPLPLPAASPPDLPPAVAALDGEPAVRALYRLGARARAGDARAAFDAFEIADFCVATERLRSALLALPAAAGDPDQAPREARFERGSWICDGATPALLAERYRHLQVAAEGGVAGAAVRLLDAAADGSAAPPMDRVIELARRDARGGDIDALSAMTRLYQFGGAIEPDPEQALVFAVATEDRMQARAQDFSPGELAMEHLLVVEFESKLGADRSEAAHRAASGIFAN